MQREITKKTPLLDKRGKVATPGWARRMYYVYNRERARRNPVNLKEWNFYQLIKDHMVVQLTIGHVSYACNAAVTVLDLDTGERLLSWSSLRPFRLPALDRDPERPGVVEYRDGGYVLRFEVAEGKRLLDFGPAAGPGEYVVDGSSIHLELENDPDNEKMVIATPFEEGAHKFYLNYKENFYRVTGSVYLAGREDLSWDGASGVLDWGRGIWPYRHEWWWGNLSAQVDGEDFGFNLGWGFGDLSHATENVYFYKRKAYKLGVLQVEREGGYMKPWRLRDGGGRLELRFRPVYDNYTENKLLVVNTHCNQVFGWFDGWAETEEGRVEFHDLLAFLEHAVNRW